MFAYCNNNPIIHRDSTGAALDTVFDIISLAASIVEVAKNPKNPWAWVGLAGDVIDVVVPFVGGVGETVKVLSTTKKIANTVDAVDDAYDAARVVDKMESLCFVEGTLVCAEAGEIPIEDIHTGDYVWAWDEETGEVALKEVVETYINETDELIHIHVNEEEIVTTPSHPFYSPVKGWTDAVHLRAGDILVLVNGEYVVVEKVQHEILEAPIKVYNFHVEDYHTYYVGELGILVHNSCGAKISEFKSVDPEHFETTYGLATGTFHRKVKPAILKEVKPSYKVGKNPDIMMNKKGQIAYQGAKNKVFQLTEIYMNDVLRKI